MGVEDVVQWGDVYAFKIRRRISYNVGMIPRSHRVRDAGSRYKRCEVRGGGVAMRGVRTDRIPVRACLLS